MYADIIDKSFPKNHMYLNKLFNKNNMGFSYRTTQNMGSIIASHNRMILNQHKPKERERGCNCRAGKI